MGEKKQQKDGKNVWQKKHEIRRLIEGKNVKRSKDKRK